MHRCVNKVAGVENGSIGHRAGTKPEKPVAPRHTVVQEIDLGFSIQHVALVGYSLFKLFAINVPTPPP